MGSCARCLWLAALLVLCVAPLGAQSSSTKSSPKATEETRHAGLDAGAVGNGVYRNKSLALTVKIPAGWVLRTEEMKPSPQSTQSGTEESRVLLAAFSRPPEARGEDVNASLVIAAESVAAYPGLKDAAQYFGPLTEVAKAQGFTVDEEPYEFAIQGKNLVRGDFHKDIGTRVMRQSTLAFLAHGYAVSITVIGGTEDEVEGLIDGISFAGK